jgi:hypothetical protein
MPRPGRPELTPALTGAELLRWCWLKRELIDLARQREADGAPRRIAAGAEDDGAHRVARRLVDHTPLLAELGTRSRDFR